MYAQMNQTSLVAASTSQYIDLTLELLANQTRYEHEKTQLALNYEFNLHKNIQVAEEWLVFLSQLKRTS